MAANKSSSSPGFSELRARATGGDLLVAATRDLACAGGLWAGLHQRESWCWGSPCSVALRSGEECVIFRTSWVLQVIFVAFC